MSRYVRNETAGDYDIEDLGLTIPASPAEIDLAQEDISKATQSILNSTGDINIGVTAGNLTLRDINGNIIPLADVIASKFEVGMNGLPASDGIGDDHEILRWEGDELLNSTQIFANEATLNQPRLGISNGSGTDFFLSFNSGGTAVLGKNTVSGAMFYMPDAVNPQIIFGTNGAGTVNTYLDCDNNGGMRLNTLHTGPVVTGPGGIEPSVNGTAQNGNTGARWGQVVTRNVNIEAVAGATQLELDSTTGTTSWKVNAGRTGFFDNWLLFTNEGETANYTAAISQNGQFWAKPGSAGGPGFTFDGASNFGMSYYATNNETIISANGIGALAVQADGTLSVRYVANYETLVTNDDDIPNKKYVDDTAAAASPITISTINGEPIPTFVDTSRGNKNLSTSMSELMFADTGVSTATWLDVGNANDVDSGYIMPYDGTICRATGTCDAGSGDIELYINASFDSDVISFPDVANPEANNSLNIDFNQGDKLRLRWVGQNEDDVNVSLFVRWRA